MRKQVWPSVLTVAALAIAGMTAFGSKAEAECLPRTECDALKQQFRDARDEIKSLREEARKILRQARALPRGSEQRKALRKQGREFRKEVRQLRRHSQLRETFKAYIEGCVLC